MNPNYIDTLLAQTARNMALAETWESRISPDLDQTPEPELANTPSPPHSYFLSYTVTHTSKGYKFEYIFERPTEAPTSFRNVFSPISYEMRDEVEDGESGIALHTKVGDEYALREDCPQFVEGLTRYLQTGNVDELVTECAISTGDVPAVRCEWLDELEPKLVKLFGQPEVDFDELDCIMKEVPVNLASMVSYSKRVASSIKHGRIIPRCRSYWAKHLALPSEDSFWRQVDSEWITLLSAQSPFASVATFKYRLITFYIGLMLTNCHEYDAEGWRMNGLSATGCEFVGGTNYMRLAVVMCRRMVNVYLTLLEAGRIAIRSGRDTFIVNLLACKLYEFNQEETPDALHLIDVYDGEVDGTTNWTIALFRVLNLRL